MLQGLYCLFQLISISNCASFSNALCKSIDPYITQIESFIIQEEDPQPSFHEKTEKIPTEKIIAYIEDPPSFSSSNSSLIKTENEKNCDFLTDKNRYNLWGSLLYWKASQDYMDVALTAPNILLNECCGFSFNCGKVLELSASCHPGFRGGASFGFHNTDWKILADYTYFHSKVSKSKKAPEHGFLFVKWIQPNLISNNASSRMHAKWDLNINVLNTQIGKHFFFKSKLSLLPYWGIASAWIDQEFINRLHLLFPEMPLRVKDRCSAFLIGPRVGISANYAFLPKVGLSANFAGEVFYERYKISTKQKSSTNTEVFASFSNRFTRNNPELEMYTGLYYQQCFSKKIHLKAEIGYDFQVWWNQNLMRWYNDITYIATPIGNLYFQGLSASLNFGF